MNEQYPETPQIENPQRVPIRVELEGGAAAMVRVRSETAASLGRAMLESKDEGDVEALASTSTENPNLITGMPEELRNKV